MIRFTFSLLIRFQPFIWNLPPGISMLITMGSWRYQSLWPQASWTHARRHFLFEKIWGGNGTWWNVYETCIYNNMYLWIGWSAFCLPFGTDFPVSETRWSQFCMAGGANYGEVWCGWRWVCHSCFQFGAAKRSMIFSTCHICWDNDFESI